MYKRQTELLSSSSSPIYAQIPNLSTFSLFSFSLPLSLSLSLYFFKIASMAADVSRQQIKSESSKSCLITRDFLGGCFGIESKELDLDLHVPSGWEKRLDLKVISLVLLLNSETFR